jgi:hypothetical protein
MINLHWTRLRRFRFENDGTLEAARRIAGHANSRTTKVYDRRGQKVLLEDMERNSVLKNQSSDQKADRTIIHVIRELFAPQQSGFPGVRGSRNEMN